MHVLILPGSYPRFYKPVSGIFYRDQAITLRNYDVTVGIIDPAPRTIRTFARGGLASHRFQVTTALDAGIPVLQANDWCLPFARKMYAKQFVRSATDLFQRYTRQFGTPDVIHAHEILWGGVAARAISIGSGIPYLVTEHSGSYALDAVRAWKIPYIRSTMRDASMVLAVSSELSTRLQAYGDGYSSRVVPNVVDTEFFQVQGNRAVVKQFLFASIGSQVKDKGIDILLRAFAAAFSRDENVRLEIGGDGKDRATFEALARELGIAGQVTWLGVLTREQVRDSLRRADAFVLPSRYETFGVVFIEAMATGLPVIATRCGGPEDFVDVNVGYLVEVGHVDQTAEAMTKAYRAREEWRQRASSIRQYAIDRFGQQAIGTQLLEAYTEAVAANRARGGRHT